MTVGLFMNVNSSSIHCNSNMYCFLGPISEESLFALSCKTEEDDELSKSLVAYLGFTVCQWLSAVYGNKKCVSEGNDDNSVLKNEIGHTKFEGDINWLIKLIKICIPHTLDKGNFEYFKIKLRRQLMLERKSKIMLKKKAFNIKSEKQDTKNTCKKISKNKKSNTFKVISHEIMNTDTKKEVSETFRGNPIMEILESHNIQESIALEKQEDHAPIDKSLFQDTENGVCVENTDVNKYDSLQGTSIFNKSDSEYNHFCLKENGSDNENKNKTIFEGGADSKATETTVSDDSVFDDEDIQHYDILIQQFEKKRVSVPNPYVAYPQLKIVISNYIEPYDSHIAKILNEECDTMWKSVL